MHHHDKKGESQERPKRYKYIIQVQNKVIFTIGKQATTKACINKAQSSIASLGFPQHKMGQELYLFFSLNIRQYYIQIQKPTATHSQQSSNQLKMLSLLTRVNRVAQQILTSQKTLTYTQVHTYSVLRTRLLESKLEMQKLYIYEDR